MYLCCPEKVRHKSLVFSDKTIISLGVGDHNGGEVVLRAPEDGGREDRDLAWSCAALQPLLQTQDCKGTSKKKKERHRSIISAFPLA